MKQNREHRFTLPLSVLLAGLASSSTIMASTATGDLYFTRYAGGPNVAKVSFNYDGTTATLGPEVPIAQSPGADGIIFAPNGNLLIGGQGAAVYEYKTDGTFVGAGNAINASFHLALDPSGTKVWTSPFGGPLADLPLSPNIGNAIAAHPISGSERGVTQVAFTPGGSTFYVNGNPNGYGNIGLIDMNTFSTSQFAAGVQSAHGMVYDSFTGLVTLFGAGKVGTFDPLSGTPASTLKQSGQLNADFDQGAVDGKGHALIAGNNSITFLDYSLSGDITSPNYVKIFGGFANIDDVAPLSGLGSSNVPDSSSRPVALAELAGVAGLLAFARRRSSVA